MAHGNRWVGELLGKIAGLNDGAVAASGSGFKPAQTAHLAAVREHAAVGGEVIGHGTGAEAVGFEMVNLLGSGKVEHHVGAIADCVAFKGFERNRFLIGERSQELFKLGIN